MYVIDPPLNRPSQHHGDNNDLRQRGTELKSLKRKLDGEQNNGEGVIRTKLDEEWRRRMAEISDGSFNVSRKCPARRVNLDLKTKRRRRRQVHNDRFRLDFLTMSIMHVTSVPVRRRYGFPHDRDDRGGRERAQ